MPTVAPASMDENSVRTTAWALQYNTLNTEETTEPHFAAAEALTIQYLELYLEQTFEFVAGADFESVDASATGIAFNPNRMGFETVVNFAPSSTSVPSQEDIDRLIAQAFEVPNVNAFLGLLGTLPPDNPFSSTSSVEYSSARQDFVNGNTIPRSIVALIGGICVLSVLLGGVIFSRRSRFSKKRKLKYHRSNVDVTCNSDGSHSNPSAALLAYGDLVNTGEEIDDEMEIEFGLEQGRVDATVYDPLFTAD